MNEFHGGSIRGEADDAYSSLMARWFPLAAQREVPERHIFHAQLLGKELAIWCADDGAVNVWENRCPHRGVRLTIGFISGSELLCRYHGLHFANRTGQCTFAPAQPDRKPAKVLCARTYQSAKRYGFIWTTLGSEAGELERAELKDLPVTVLRSLPINASASRVSNALECYRFVPTANLLGGPEREGRCRVEVLDVLTLRVTANWGRASTTVILFLQPVNRNRTIVHGCMEGEIRSVHVLRVLKHHSRRLTDLREVIESASGAGPDLAARTGVHPWPARVWGTDDPPL